MVLTITPPPWSFIEPKTGLVTQYSPFGWTALLPLPHPSIHLLRLCLCLGIGPGLGGLRRRIGRQGRLIVAIERMH